MNVSADPMTIPAPEAMNPEQREVFEQWFKIELLFSRISAVGVVVWTAYFWLSSLYVSPRGEAYAIFWVLRFAATYMSIALLRSAFSPNVLRRQLLKALLATTRLRLLYVVVLAVVVVFFVGSVSDTLPGSVVSIAFTIVLTVISGVRYLMRLTKITQVYQLGRFNTAPTFKD